MTMAVLVLGGAGYIGSNMVDTLIQNQEEVVVLDNLCTGIGEGFMKKLTFMTETSVIRLCYVIFLRLKRLMLSCILQH